MKRLPLLLFVPLLLGATPPAKPGRIMTLDLCDDLLLLMLVPRERIASVTFLAHDAARLLLPPGADTGIPTNHGSAEEILRQRPDLIVGSAFAAGSARRLARRVGARVIEFDDASSFADIRRNVRAMGIAVGKPLRAERLVGQMDAVLARLAASQPARPWRVVAWNGGGSVPGRGTLTDAIITAAGATNIAAQYPDARHASFDLEQVLATRPDALLQGGGNDAAPSLHRGSARHPVIARAFAGRQIDYPDMAYQCGLPQAALAAAALRARLQQVAPRRPGG